MIRSGEVTERNGGTVTVVFDRPAACGTCGGCSGAACAKVELTADADIGDAVEVEMPDKNILFASAIAYLLPLALLLTGLLGGTSLHASLAPQINANLFAAVSGLLLFGAGLAAVRAIDRLLARRRRWRPRVLRVYGSAEVTGDTPLRRERDEPAPHA